MFFPEKLHRTPFSRFTLRSTNESENRGERDTQTQRETVGQSVLTLRRRSSRPFISPALGILRHQHPERPALKISALCACCLAGKEKIKDAKAQELLPDVFLLSRPITVNSKLYPKCKMDDFFPLFRVEKERAFCCSNLDTTLPRSIACHFPGCGEQDNN